MPYSTTFRIGYGIGVTELVTSSNVYSSQASPVVGTLVGSMLSQPPGITVTNFTSTGNSILTTGNMSLSAPPSNTDFYGGYTGSVINCSEIIGGNIIGQVLSLNTINVQTDAQTTGNVSSGYLIALKANTFTNTITANSIYAGSFIGKVTGESVSTQQSLVASSAIVASSNLTGNILTSGTFTGSSVCSGNLIAGSNSVTTTGDIRLLNDIYSNISVSGQATLNRLVSQSIIGQFTGYGNVLTTSGILTATGGIIGGVQGDITSSGRFITNQYTGRLESSQPIEVSTLYGNVSAASLSAYTNNLTGVNVSGRVVGEVRTYANTISAASVIASQVFVGQMSFTGAMVTTGNIIATTFTGGFSGENVITSGSLTLSNGRLFGSLGGSNIVGVTSQVISNALTGTIVTYANSIPSINVTAGAIIADSMNTFSNTISLSRVSGNFVGPLTSTGTDIFSTGSVQAKNFVGDIDAGSNTIQTTGIVTTLTGLNGSINTFANSIVTQGLATGTFVGKYNGVGPIISNAAMTISGTSSVGSLTGGANTITVNGIISGNYIGAIQTFGNTIVATGGLSGNLIFSRVTAYQNDIVTDSTISYGKDLIKSNYGNVASYSNVLPIQTSLAYYYSNVVTRQPWWSTTSSPNVSYMYTEGQTGFSAGVLLPDGKVVMVPSTSRSIGIYDTKTNIFSNALPSGLTALASGWGWNSGVLLQNSNVAFIPGSNNYIGIYDPYRNAISLGPFISTTDAFRGGVLLPNGNVLCIPYNTFVFTEFNPDDPGAAVRNASIGGPGNSPYLWSGTLMPNGNVICAPHSGNFVIYDYRQALPSKTTDLNVVFFNKHTGSVLLPSGNVLCVPGASGYRLAQVSPAGVYSNAVSTVSGTGNYQGACILGNGKVLFGPGTGTNIGVYDIYTDTIATVPIESGYGVPIALPDGRAILPPRTSLYGVAIVSGVTQINEHLPTSSYFNKF